MCVCVHLHISIHIYLDLCVHLHLLPLPPVSFSVRHPPPHTPQTPNTKHRALPPPHQPAAMLEPPPHTHTHTKTHTTQHTTQGSAALPTCCWRIEAPSASIDLSGHWSCMSLVVVVGRGRGRARSESCVCFSGGREGEVELSSVAPNE
jgi:hypothetical protein